MKKDDKYALVQQLIALGSTGGVVSLEEINESGKDYADEDIEMFDGYAWEKFLHRVPQDQLELFVCLYLGMQPTEIVAALGYPNVRRFYKMNGRLKDTYKKQKHLFIAYN